MILSQPLNASVDIFEPVVFECVAEGFRLTTVTWRKDGYALPSTATTQTSTSHNKISSVLNITKSAWYYTGRYYCIAENEAGSVNSQYAKFHVRGN